MSALKHNYTIIKRSDLKTQYRITNSDKIFHSREETIMLEIPQEEEPLTIEVFENNSTTHKPVPLATVRSSKLAAMAANLNEDVESELEADLPSGEIDEINETESETTNDPSMVKLEDILIIPEIMTEDNPDSVENRIISSDVSTLSDSSKNTNSPNSVHSGDFEDSDVREQTQINFTGSRNNGSTRTDKSNQSNRASTSSSPNNLSLSRVNTSGLTDDAYRLAPT